MVDALRRVRTMLTPSGMVVDIHPTADPAVLLVGDVVAGVVESEAGAARHRAATETLAEVERRGWFAIEVPSTFEFFTGGETVDELCEYVLANWRDTAIAPETRARARLLAAGGLQPRVRECVAICRVMPR